jgi:hypothetical protein
MYFTRYTTYPVLDQSGVNWLWDMLRCGGDDSFEIDREVSWTRRDGIDLSHYLWLVKPRRDLRNAFMGCEDAKQQKIAKKRMLKNCRWRRKNGLVSHRAYHKYLYGVECPY